MILTDLLDILESDNKRDVISLKQDGNTVSYKLDDATVTVNSTSISNVSQICLRNIDGTVYVYLNHTSRFEYTKYKLTDINTFTMT